jgi:hypothetical protein
MWAGVSYGEGAKYAREVKARYKDEYEQLVKDAVKMANSRKGAVGTVQGVPTADLRKHVLNMTRIHSREHRSVMTSATG